MAYWMVCDGLLDEVLWLIGWYVMAHWMESGASLVGSMAYWIEYSTVVHWLGCGGLLDGV